jgi:hypothetical protein
LLPGNRIFDLLVINEDYEVIFPRVAYIELVNKAYSLYLTQDHNSTFLQFELFSITNLSQLNPMMRNWRENGQVT